MKIVICSSIDFSHEINQVSEELKKAGHEVEIPYFATKIINGEVDLDKYLRVKKERGDIEYRRQADENLIKRYFRIIKDADAILVLNLDKKGIKHYVGGNTFLEMGFAHVLGKKIFLSNDIPEMGYSDEMKEMDLVVINGDLSKVSDKL